MIRTASALALAFVITGCGTSQPGAVEVGDVLVFEDRGSTAQVTVERVGDCATLRAEAERLDAMVWTDDAEGECAWAEGTATAPGGVELPVTVVRGVRGFSNYERAE